MINSEFTYKNKVALITGAAHGIGRGIAEHCAKQKMKLVITDIEETALLDLRTSLENQGCDVLAVVTDISREDHVKLLAKKAFDRFGAIQFLFNNAGVGVGGSSWETSMSEWNWCLDVNLKGVIYGLKYFIPHMLHQDEVCTVVNTASLAGLTTGAGLAPYIVTKHAVVSLTETLFHDLAIKKSKIKTAVFCPVIVNTQIMDSHRNAPDAVKTKIAQRTQTDEEHRMETSMREALSQGMTIEQSADCLFKGLEAGQFYILTHPVCTSMVETRFKNIMNNNTPTIPMIPG